MPGSLTYSGARYPTNTESDTVPADFLRFGTDIDQLLVLKAASVSDRDAKYANVTAGTLVSCAALGVVWQKKADGSSGGWRALATVGPVVTSGIATAASNFTIAKQVGRVVNGSIYLNVQLNYTGPDIVANPATETVPSNIVDIPICTLDAAWMPDAAFLTWPTYFRSIYAGGTCEIRSDNQVWLTTLYTAAKLRSGDPGGFATSWPVP